MVIVLYSFDAEPPVTYMLSEDRIGALEQIESLFFIQKKMIQQILYIGISEKCNLF